jgi:hypothetical protein
MLRRVACTRLKQDGEQLSWSLQDPYTPPSLGSTRSCSRALAEKKHGKDNHHEDRNDANNERRRAGGPGRGALILAGFSRLLLCHTFLLNKELERRLHAPGTPACCAGRAPGIGLAQAGRQCSSVVTPIILPLASQGHKCMLHQINQRMITQYPLSGSPMPAHGLTLRCSRTIAMKASGVSIVMSS